MKRKTIINEPFWECSIDWPGGGIGPWSKPTEAIAQQWIDYIAKDIIRSWMNEDYSVIPKGQVNVTVVKKELVHSATFFPPCQEIIKK